MATITIKWTGKATGEREFTNERVAARFAEGLERTGYTVETVTEEPAPAAEAETTGRIGKGREVHRIVAGVAHCGASYRARKMGGTLPTTVTGEAITCSKCLAH
jgi:hypothetical protein